MILTIKDKSSSLVKKNVDKLIQDSFEQSQNLEELIQEAPIILEGYKTFRNILREIKRGSEMDEAIQNNCLESCPPNAKSCNMDSSVCGEVSCNNCWKDFINRYSDGVLRQQE